MKKRKYFIVFEAEDNLKKKFITNTEIIFKQNKGVESIKEIKQILKKEFPEFIKTNSTNSLFFL